MAEKVEPDFEEGESISEDEKAQRVALERITRSRPFAAAKARGELLRFLFDNRHQRMSEVDIAVEHLGIERAHDIDSGRARKLCSAVRKALTEYSETDVSHDGWEFALGDANRDGYQLNVINRHTTMHATQRFWNGHLNPSRPVVIVYDEPVFYRDEPSGTVIRIPRLEAGADMKSIGEATAEFKRVLREEITGPLTPCHLYMLSGAIGARDKISEWFADEYALKTEYRISRLMRDVSDTAGCASILLGNVRTNKIMREMVELKQFRHLGYHVEAKEFRTIEIREFTEEEREELDRYEPTISGNTLLLRDDPRPDKPVFCVVTRVPNIYDRRSATTIISSGYTKVMEAVANTLTDGQLLSEALATTKIPMDAPFPRYFQGLFSVRLGPTGPDDKAQRPWLRCCRFFNRLSEQP